MEERAGLSRRLVRRSLGEGGSASASEGGGGVPASHQLPSSAFRFAFRADVKDQPDGHPPSAKTSGAAASAPLPYNLL